MVSHPTDRPAYAPFTPSKSEQRSFPPCYRGCWHGVSRNFLCGYRQDHAITCVAVSFPLTGFYTPKSFVTHAALLRQAFAHCAIFPTAASRRSLGRISVPVWPITLSGRLSIAALVGFYPTNKLMDRGPIHRRRPSEDDRLSSGTDAGPGHHSVLDPLSKAYPEPLGKLPTCYAPVRRFTHTPKDAFSLDLHV